MTGRCLTRAGEAEQKGAHHRVVSIPGYYPSRPIGLSPKSGWALVLLPAHQQTLRRVLGMVRALGLLARHPSATPLHAMQLAVEPGLATPTGKKKKKKKGRGLQRSVGLVMAVCLLRCLPLLVGGVVAHLPSPPGAADHQPTEGLLADRTRAILRVSGASGQSWEPSHVFI